MGELRAAIDGTTRVLVHLAYPSAHLRTPQLFNPRAAERGVNAVLVPWQIRPDHLAEAMAGLRHAESVAGAIVTIPHKETAARLCDRLDGVAAILKVANVIRREPDGSLTGKGVWRPGAREETRLGFKLDVSNVEKMLTRLGYPEAVRRGKGELEGEVVWHGPPTALHIASLGGKMRVQAENGQFAQLEPGVGRLLGVLSLQALPRRITLDFRDVFSQGFAFDRISGSIQMNQGVLHTDDLEILGPAARVFMSGEADAARETQNLRVRVQPTLSESIAVGSAIATTGMIHPAVGLAAYLVQKALRDPVEKLFSFEYAVTGGWSDPKVEKLAARPAAAPVP